jgi:hypothetical protein
MYSENRLENVLFWKKLEPAGFRIFGTGWKMYCLFLLFFQLLIIITFSVCYSYY